MSRQHCVTGLIAHRKLLKTSRLAALAAQLADIQRAGVLRTVMPQDSAPFGSVGANLQLRGWA